MMLIRTVAAVIAAFCMHTANAATNHLINGSFESPGDTLAPDKYILLSGGDTRITGWITVLNGVEYDDISFPGIGTAHNPFLGIAHDGRYSVDLNPGTLTGGGIQQTFPTVSGKNYTATFHLASTTIGGRTGIGNVTATAAGITNTFSVTNQNDFLLWSAKTFEFTALSAITTLRLSSSDNPLTHVAQIDDVSVIESPTNATTSIGFHPGITVTGTVGKTYVIEYSETLGNPTWKKLQYLKMDTPTRQWFDTTSGGNTNRFYRVIEVP